ncbi:MAG: riboflavin synthase [Candidatus Omnitrophica bacterium]|nr:riboflavin synthase [Candidatus Omnitrophota bacterium]
MFTGIVEESGKIQEVRKTASGTHLAVQTKKTHRESGIGSSLSVNGVCLTVVEKRGKILSFDVSKNSLRLTTLGDLKKGDFVNLERPLKLGSRVGGHFVQGHVDGVGIIQNRRKEGKNLIYKIRCRRSILSSLIPRASIAVDGVSLTVTRLHRGGFHIYLIPHTLKVTGLAKKRGGDKVNLEVDLLSKLLHKQGRFPMRNQRVPWGRVGKRPY